MFTRIVTVTDGSERCLHAVETASKLAIRLGSRIAIISVSEAMVPVAASEGYFVEADLASMRRAALVRENGRLSASMAIAKNLGVPDSFVQGEVCEESDVVTAVLRAADRMRAELIVIGSRGRHSLARAFLGSPTADVIAKTSIPVLVVK